MATADCRTSPKPAVARDGLGLLLLWIASASISWIPASSCARALSRARFPLHAMAGGLDRELQSEIAKRPQRKRRGVRFDRLRLLLGGEGKRVKLQLRLLVA